MTNSKTQRKRTNFSQISNHVLRDETLSLKAKGLYSLIQSYITLDGFVIYKNTMKKHCSEGGRSFDNAWKELKEKGYLLQKKIHTQGGRFRYEYTLDDKQRDENQAHVLQGVDNAGLDNAGGGKRGPISNNDLKNIDINKTAATNKRILNSGNSTQGPRPEGPGPGHIWQL